MEVNDHLKSSKLFDVNNFRAVVTGGASGIGLMITQSLVANGAKVYIISRRREAIDRVVEIYSRGPGQIIRLPGDVGSKEDIKRLAEELGRREPGGVQLLVNNAGVAAEDATKFGRDTAPDDSDPTAISEHFMKSDPSAWSQAFEVNTGSSYFMSMALLPLLAKGSSIRPGFSSSIINIASIPGVGKSSSRGQFAYGASKAAVIYLSRMLAATFTKTSVRVNTICPALFPSEMTTGSSDENQKSHMDIKSRNPAGR